MILRKAQFIHKQHFFNWKKGKEKLDQHQASVPHRLVLTQKVQADFAQVIDAGLVKKRAEEKHYLLNIITHQQCTLFGHTWIGIPGYKRNPER